MTSKESLRNLKQEILTPNYLTDYEKDECIDVIQQDLERLKVLEEENQELKNRLANEQLAFDKLFESNQKLSELYAKLKQALDILKDKIEFEDLGEMQSGNVYRGYFNDCFDEEEYELLKEVLGNE